jgi:hypothetical protein
LGGFSVDLRQYFKKLRDVEAAIEEEFPFVVSLETSDGGKPGVISEVSRELAAKGIVNGQAVLADKDQKLAYLELQAQRKKAAQKAELAKRLQIAIVSGSELETAPEEVPIQAPPSKGK